MPYLGHLAALGAALCWTLNSLVMERKGRGLSSWGLNMLTKLGGLILVSTLAWLLEGRLIPQANASQWSLLLLSGFIGFSIGDGFLFTAFQQIGARRTMLIFSANPVLAAILGWALMGEALTIQHIIGILLAVSGIMLVIRGDVPAGSKAAGWQGILWATLATLGQAAGVILSKLGLATLDAVPAAQIRLIGGVVGMALILTAIKRWNRLFPILKSESGLQVLTVSIVLGTLVGMVLSMLSIKLIPAAIASILFSLMPVMILPLSAFVLKEKVNSRETLGALVTVAGVSLLFL
ncbi:MAG: DMT family transporter [Eubacteriales bacterium]|jgi:drug/metabolite transporter (DMT)-like permease|nr:DMT family transporter [Eubacteriales bacterium]MDD3572490.1 DMT family transporter [Eubacteriales bacterium]MDD4134753.1 DMT family transporter [Eubacteriales bacterium]NLO13161.1 DMT family transporter [Clostridiales bacterium]